MIERGALRLVFGIGQHIAIFRGSDTLCGGVTVARVRFEIFRNCFTRYGGTERLLGLARAGLGPSLGF